MTTEHNENNPDDFQPSKEARFDFLMKRYLAREASDPETEELHRLAGRGMQDRFQMWLDEADLGGLENVSLSNNARHEILGHILGQQQPRARRMGYGWGWAAAVLIALGSLAWLTLRETRPVQIPVAQNPAGTQPDERRVLAGKQYVTLPDGSTVLMNEGSELSYTAGAFRGDSREVTLKGEAYFDIVRDPQRPFLVRSGSVVTRVLGTSFNVNMRGGQVVVTVTRGLVEVGDKQRVYARIKPDEQITVDTQTEQFSTVAVRAAAEVSWKDAYLVLDNVDLEKAGELIGGHYGVAVVFTAAEVKKCRISASFLNGESLETVLNVLSRMIGATYQMEGKTVTVEGGSCQ